MLGVSKEVLKFLITLPKLMFLNVLFCVQALVVVGTSQGWGEDYPCQGRLVPIRIEQSSRGGRGHVLSSRQAKPPKQP